MLFVSGASPVAMRQVLPVGTVLALAAGLAEELLFRGILWSFLEGTISPIGAWLVSSVLFGAAHGLWHPTLRTWGLFAIAAGLVLGGLRLGSGGLLAPMVAHVLVDAINIPLTLKVSGGVRP